MKKILIVAHLSRFIAMFELNNITALQRMGYEVHCATNTHMEPIDEISTEKIQAVGVIVHQVDFCRSPFQVLSLRQAYQQLCGVMRGEKYSAVHCHTPVAGILARMAAHKVGIQPVLYTAHGFHFYKGCPIQNRLIYETAERYFAQYTDALITINQEDYEAAQNRPVRGNVYYVPGIGVDLCRFEAMRVNHKEKREEIGVPEGGMMLISVGELSKRKNHEVVLDAIARIDSKNLYYVICGEGALKEHLRSKAKEYGIIDRVRFLGHRQDIGELLKVSDVFCFPSLQEGLPVALMEAMACGVICVASDIRGNRDLISNHDVLFQPRDVDTLCQIIGRIIHLSQEKKVQQIEENLRKMELFKADRVQSLVGEIYQQVLSRTE